MKIWGRREQRKVRTCPHLEEPAPLPHGWDTDGNGDGAGLRLPGSPVHTVALPTPGNAVQGEGVKYVEGAGGGRRGQEDREFSSLGAEGATMGGDRRLVHQKRPFIPLNFLRSLPSSWLVIHAPI